VCFTEALTRAVKDWQSDDKFSHTER